MAANDRETTFTIKAADLSSQEITKVISTVERLVGVMEKVNKAATDGTIKTQDFGKAYKDLGTGADAVARQITTLQRYAAVSEEVERRQAALTKLQEQRAALAEKGDLSRSEKAQANRLDKQIENAEKALNRQNEAFAKSQEAMKAMGSSVETLGADLDRLRAFASRLTGVLNESATAQLHLTENQLKAAASAKAEADALEATAKATKDAENAAKARTKQREDDLTAQQRQYNFEQQANALALKNADERLAKEKQLAEARERIAAQRDLTSQAIGRLPAISPLGQPAAPLQDFSKVNRELSGLVDPAAAARQTIDGLTAAIDKLLNAIESGKRTPKDLNNDLRALGNAAQDLKKLGGLIDAFQAQEAAVKRADQAVKGMERTMAALTAKGQTLTAVDKEYVNEVKQAEAESRRLIEVLEQENREYTRQAEILQRAGINHKHLDEDVSRLRASAAGMGKVFTQAAEAASGDGKVFLGLRPYELQNLSYQINDVFTQLGSGTPVMQVFAQQGGQVFQLFQVQLLSFVKTLKDIPFAIPGIVAGVGTLIVVLSALGRAMEEASAKRAFLANIALDVDKVNTTAEGLLEAAKSVEKLGATFGDAAKGATEFQKAGFSNEQTKQFLTIATQLSIARKIPLTDAVKGLIGALQGGYEEVHKFNVDIARLSSAEDERIKKLLEANKVEEARAALMAALGPRAAEAYGKMQSEVEKSARSIVTRWHELQETIADEGTATKWNNFWATVIHGADNAAKVVGLIARGMAAIKSALPSVAAGDTAGVAGIAGGTGRTPNAGASPAGPEFTAMRDQTAAAVGLSRQAMALLQNSEGQFKNNKWQDSESGAIGPMQILQKTFDGLKAQYPELIKGTIHDVESNLMAGALYFRDILKQTGGDFKEAVLGYKNGPGTVTGGGTPEQIAERRGRINPRWRGQNDASAADLATAVTDPPLVGGPAPVVAVINRAEIATRNWEKAERERRAEAESGHGDEIKQLDNLEQRIDIARQKVLDSANKAGAKDGARIDPAAILRQQNAEEQKLRDDFARQRAEQEAEADNELRAARDRVLQADKTNLQQRLDANKDYYDKYGAMISAHEREGKAAPRGMTYEQWRAEIGEIEQRDREKTTAETAEAVVQAAVEKQQTQFNRLKELQANGKASGLELVRQLHEIDGSTAKVVESLKQAIATLDKLPQTPAVVAMRERLRTQQQIAETRPAQSREIVQTGIQQAGESVRTASDTRNDRLDAVEALLRGGRMAFADGLKKATAIIAETRPILEKAVAEAKSNLAALGPDADPRQRATIEKTLAEAEARLAKGGEEQINKIIEAGLHDAVEERDRLVKERDAKIAEILKKPNLAPGEMNRQLMDVARASNAEIEAAKKRLIALYREAMTLPNLTAGQRAKLQEGIAQTEATDTSGKDQQLQAITGPSGTLTQLNQLRSGLAETQRAVKERLAVGGITAEEGEAKVKKAFEDANKAGQPLIATLRAQADALEAMGEKASVVENLRAKADELGASFKYATDFQRAFTKTLEDSLSNRGMQAIDGIAQALGRAVVGMESWKDVISDIGTAFANFAAGVLKDLATMIIKMYLYKLVQSSIGAMGGVPVMHSGGEVGAVGGVTRNIDMSAFMFARRMHTGGGVGLANDEVPTILQRGEVVLSKAQAAQRANGSGGGGGSGQTGIRNVLAVGDREIAGAMNGAHGEKVILNVLQRNAPTVKKMVG